MNRREMFYKCLKGAAFTLALGGVAWTSELTVPQPPKSQMPLSPEQAVQQQTDRIQQRVAQFHQKNADMIAKHPGARGVLNLRPEDKAYVEGQFRKHQANIQAIQKSIRDVETRYGIKSKRGQ